MISTIQSLDDFFRVIEENQAVLIYFSHEKCNVCKVLKPQILNLVQKDFPKIKMVYSNTEISPEIAAQNSIFTVPTILVYFEKKEYLRKSRFMSIEMLKIEIERPYNLIFS